MQTFSDTLRAALLSSLRQSPLVAELGASGLLEIVGDVTLRELVDSGSARRGRPRKQTAGAKPAAVSATSKRGKVNLRTRDGRSEYQDRVLAVVTGRSGKPVSVEDVISGAGGEMNQARSALHRLIKTKKVKGTGKTRATRYSAA